MKPVLLELQRVSKRFDSPGGSESVEVLKEISLSISSGESVAVIGPSGSGKSTLLNIIGTLDTPSEGRVILAGESLSALNEEQLAQVRNRQIVVLDLLEHKVQEVEQLCPAPKAVGVGDGEVVGVVVTLAVR